MEGRSNEAVLPVPSYYVEDRLEAKQRSLGTRDKAEAARLLAAYTEADKNRLMNLQMARVYATASEPEIATRTWNDVFSAILSSKKNKETAKRWNIAWKDEFIASLLQVKLMETTAKQFWTALSNGTVSTVTTSSNANWNFRFSRK